MTKVLLTDVGSITNNPISAVNIINNNNDVITAAFDNTLSLDGTSPNQMGANFDMNSNRVLNLPAPISGSEPLRLQDLESFNSGGTIASLPPGGSTGQGLIKNSGVDFDVGWNNIVSSVGLSLPSDLTVTNSPVISSGTLTGNWAVTPTGTGAMVRQVSPALVTPDLGTPSTVTLTNASGTASALTAGHVTTNANLTGPITSTGNATSVASQTGTGSKFVMDTAPTISAPVISTITNTGTLTLPTSSDTLVGRATTDTLTNKTISGASNTLSNIALSSHANQAGFTFVGNNTSGSAAPTAVDISTLTAKASPTSTDLLLISDQAASGAWKKVTVSSISSAGSVSSIAGNTGAFTLNATSGITNSTNDIILSQGSSSQFGAVKVDNTTIQAASGVISTKANTFTNYLGSNTAISTNTDGPAAANGSLTGVFLAVGTVTIKNASAGGETITLSLTDGTTTVTSCQWDVLPAGQTWTATLVGLFTNPAGNIRIRATASGASVSYIFNGSGFSKDCGITVVRLQ